MTPSSTLMTPSVVFMFNFSALIVVVVVTCVFKFTRSHKSKFTLFNLIVRNISNVSVSKIGSE